MPRKLPWIQRDAAAAARLKNTATVSNGSSRIKGTPEEGYGGRSMMTKRRTEGGRKRSLSTSPPPEAPMEESMREGIDADDKYRMVEDEFLAIAHQFTVHLHTAEYKRREKEVRSRRADAIHSISRPVVGKMPDHTKRKTASVAQSHAQRTALEKMVGTKQNKPENSDSDNDIELPYRGTTLHGLMDSPRKKSAALLRARLGGAATRAAAGYKKAARQSKVFYPQRSESPKAQAQLKLEDATKVDSSTEDGEDSDDDEDDLDAPIRR